MPDFRFHNRELVVLENTDMKYYEGEISARKTTDGGNLLITMSNPFSVKKEYGVVKKTKMEYPSMNFLVPKRREFICNKLASIPIETKIMVQLQPESRSGKLCVSEFHISR